MAVFVAPPGSDLEARPFFVRLAPPTNAGVEAVLKKILQRVRELIERRGRSDFDRGIVDGLGLA